MKRNPLLVAAFLVHTHFAYAQGPQQQILENVRKGVVEIEVQSVISADGEEAFITGEGSGLIVDLDLEQQKARILTNHHVVRHAKELKVTFSTGKKMDSRQDGGIELLGTDPWIDVAVIEIDLTTYPGDPLTDLYAIPRGDSDAISNGDPVIAIGNARGIQTRETAGIISQKEVYIGNQLGRTMGSKSRVLYIDTDAAINPGNSGGPLINQKGEWIGINTLGMNGANNMGYAIPSKRVQHTVDHILSKEPLRCDSGIAIQPLPPFHPTSNGALIACVHPNSSAQTAGLRRGDLLTHVEHDNAFVSISLKEDELSNFPRIWELLEELPVPGDTLSIILFREGARDTLQIITQPDLMTDTTPSFCPALHLVLTDISEFDRQHFQSLKEMIGVVLLDFNYRYYNSELMELREPKILSGLWVDSEYHAIERLSDLEPFCQKESLKNNPVILELRGVSGNKLVYSKLLNPDQIPETNPLQTPKVKEISR